VKVESTEGRAGESKAAGGKSPISRCIFQGNTDHPFRDGDGRPRGRVTELHLDSPFTERIQELTELSEVNDRGTRAGPSEGLTMRVQISSDTVWIPTFTTGGATVPQLRPGQVAVKAVTPDSPTVRKVNLLGSPSWRPLQTSAAMSGCRSPRS
jgi:hypothetical protein